MRTMAPAFLLSALIFALAPPVRSEEPPVLDPELPYRAERLAPVTYDVDFSVVVTPPYQTKSLRVWLPIPPSDGGQEVSASRLTSFPMKVEPQVGAEPTYGNKFAYFEFANPLGAQIVRHQFRIRVWELRWHLDPTRVREVAEWPASFARFRQGDSQAVVVDDRFRKLVGEIAPERSDPFGGLSRILTWAQTNLTYDHVDASLRASAEHALEKRRGHCSDYHGLCASLGRALGYPTRVTYGINAFPKNSPSHCKLEAFLPPYGWVSFDVSETQKLADAIARNDAFDEEEKRRLSRAAQARLVSGFRDNTWFLQTRGTDYELAPPAKQRVPVVRTAYVEADGKQLADPDPANKKETAHAWMTVHQYVADRDVTYPFTDLDSLREAFRDKKSEE